MDKTTYNKRKYTIEKTQGTKNSMGSFMVFDENGEEIWDSKTNSNAWDTYQEALQVKERLVWIKRLWKQELFFLKKIGLEWIGKKLLEKNVNWIRKNLLPGFNGY